MMTFGFKGPDAEKGEAFEQWLPALRDAGFSWVEIRAPEGPDPVWEERLRGWRKQFGLELSVHARYSGINLSSPNPKVRRAAVEVAREDLEFAARIGARRLNLHAGDVNWYDVPPPDHPDHAWMVEELNRLRARHLAAAALSIAEIEEMAIATGIEVLVENLYKPWDLLLTPEEVRAFLETFNQPPGFTLDTGHALVAGCSPVAFLRPLNGRIRHLHLHWNDGAFDVHNFPDLSEPPLREFLEAIGQINSPPVVVIEVVPGSPKGTIEQFLEWPAQFRELLRAWQK